jgi:hypothetical protein
VNEFEIDFHSFRISFFPMVRVLHCLYFVLFSHSVFLSSLLFSWPLLTLQRRRLPLSLYPWMACQVDVALADVINLLVGLHCHTCPRGIGLCADECKDAVPKHIGPVTQRHGDVYEFVYYYCCCWWCVCCFCCCSSLFIVLTLQHSPCASLKAYWDWCIT